MKYFQFNKSLIQQIYLIFVAVLCFLIAILWQHYQMESRSQLEETLPSPLVVVSEPVQPIPRAIALNFNRVTLGQKLFADPQLSRNHRLSCLSCHNLATGGTDGQLHPVEIQGQIAMLNTLTVFNSSFNFKLNWDGSFDSLESQIDEAISNPKGMNSSWEALMAKLKKSPDYQKTFNQLYPGKGLTPETIKNAIATYERSLYTPNSRFDQFLLGDRQALTKTEQAGYQLFKTYGCISCHQGMNVGGNLFQKFGITQSSFSDRLPENIADRGRFNLTQNREDMFVFRVPSLRNVARTAPYFHDGSAKTLEDAIAVMAEYQLGRKLLPEKINQIAQFLQTLTGEYQGKPL